MHLDRFNNELLYRYQGVLWQEYTNSRGDSWLVDAPFCSTEGCRAELLKERGLYFCNFCKKDYLCPDGYEITKNHAERRWRGSLLGNAKIVSLDLPPTQVTSASDDENYWIQARIGEKNGKRMAVVYFGEKVKGIQSKTDYAQLFVDFEDEQIRFDKSNKNPLKILAKLTLDFPNSTVVHKKK